MSDQEDAIHAKTIATCDMCRGTMGYVTLEGEDMERVWNPCSYCKGTGINGQHPLLHLGSGI